MSIRSTLRGFIAKILFGVLVAAAPLVLAAEGATAGDGLSTLREQLLAIVDRPPLASARWGIKVQSLESGVVLFEKNPDSRLIPASNTKLFTAALVLDQLGVDFKLRTSVYGTTLIDKSGTLRGDLIVYGRGDPTLGSDSPYPPIRQLVSSLRSAGLRRVKGDLQLDESFFTGAETGVGWLVEDLSYYYSPEVSALTLHGNGVDWIASPGMKLGENASIRITPPCDLLLVTNRIRTVPRGTRSDVEAIRLLGSNKVRVWGEIALGSPSTTNTITIHQPAAWFGQLFLQELIRQGIRVEGRTYVVGDWERKGASANRNSWVELASFDSPPVSELVFQMMKPSNNLFAQLLFLQAGAHQIPTNDAETTDDRAAVAMTQFLRRVLGTDSTPAFEEGSGLSRRHTVSASEVVALLRFMQKHPASSAFQNALPIAGRDGTLVGRLRGSAAEANLRAKTGSLRSVNTLSGYVTSAAGEPLVFSIFLNDYISRDPKRHARDEIDGVARLLAEFSSRTR